MIESSNNLIVIEFLFLEGGFLILIRDYSWRWIFLVILILNNIIMCCFVLRNVPILKWAYSVDSLEANTCWVMVQHTSPNRISSQLLATKYMLDVEVF